MSKRQVLLATLACAVIGVTGLKPALTLAQGNTPPRAYYIADFELTDAEGIRPYSAGVPSTLEPFGGRFVVRGGRIDSLEGAAPGARTVMIEFPSMAQAQAWYNSEAYRALRPIRQRSGTTRAFILEGLPN